VADFTILDVRNNLWALSSTSDCTVSYPTTTTSHKVESGSRVIDNTTNNNVTITFNGVISQVATLSLIDVVYARGVEIVPSFIEAIKTIRNNKESVTVSVDERFESFSGCVITDFETNRTASTGLGYSVRISFEQNRKAERASVTVERDVQAIPDVTESKTNSEGGNTETKPSGTLLIQGTNFVLTPSNPAGG
jgi:hypothetical protein